jgi:alpha-tubulin suppressor-like RCC1 family protein
VRKAFLYFQISICLLILSALAFGQTTTSGLVTEGYWKFSESTSSLSKPKQISVAAGLMVLRADGSVYSSRPRSSRDQAGKVILIEAPGFDIPEDLPPLTAIAAGNNVSIGLRADGKVITWGLKTLPIEPPTGLAHVVKVVSGGDHVVVLKDDGSVAAWGSSANGQCDLGAGLPKIVDIAALPTTTILVAENGNIIQFGKSLRRLDQAPGDPEPASNFTRVSAGGGRFVALRVDGSGTVFDPWEFRDFYFPYYRIVIPPSPKVSSFACDGNLIALFDNGDSIQDLPAGATQVSASVNGVYSDQPETPHLQAKNLWVLTDSGSLIPYAPDWYDKIRANYDAYQIGSEPNRLDRLVSISSIIGRTNSSDNSLSFISVGLKTDGSVVSMPSGLPVEGFPKLKDISFSISTTRSLYAIGLTGSGTLVDLETAKSNPPTLTNIVSVSALPSYALALNSSGKLFGWNFDGTPFNAIPTNLSTVKQLEGTYVVLKNGRVQPINLEGIAGVLALRNVSKIQVSKQGLFALKSDGTVTVLGDSGSWNNLTKLTSVADIYARYDQVATKDQQGFWKAWSLDGSIPFKSDLLTQYQYFQNQNNFEPLLIGIPDFGIQFTQATLSSGGSVSGQLWLSRPAPAGGISIALTGSDPDVLVPTSVTVKPGSREATFKVTASSTNRTVRPVIVAAQLGTTTKRTSLLIASPVKISVDKSSIVGGSEQQIALTVSLAKPTGSRAVNYALAYSDPSLHGPALITIPAQQSSATVQLSADAVPSPCAVTVTATGGLDSATTTVYVTQPRTTLACASSILGGDLLSVQLTTDVKVNRDTTFSVQSSQPDAVPNLQITVPANSPQGYATVVTDASSTRPPTVLSTKTSSVSVNVVGMDAELLDSVAGSSGLATLTVPIAPATDRVITVQGAGGFDQLPASVILPKGSLSVDVPFHVSPSAKGPLELTLGSDKLNTLTRKAKVLAGRISTVTLTRTVRGGSPDVLSLSVTLEAPTPADIQLELSSWYPDIVSVPATLKIAAGAKSAKITLTHFAVTATKRVGITVKLGDQSVEKIVVVTKYP